MVPHKKWSREGKRSARNISKPTRYQRRTQRMSEGRADAATKLNVIMV